LRAETILLPVHPICSIRRSQGRGVSRPIAPPACQLLGQMVSCPDISAVRSRCPAAPEVASESHLRSPGGNIGACRSPGAEHAPRGVDRVLMRSVACGQSISVDLLAKHRAIRRCESRDTVLTERRPRCVHPALILPYSGDVVCSERPRVFGAVQNAPIPRIRPREIQRCGRSEAHGASKSRQSNMKLAVCSESSRQIRHIRMVSARPDART
jgi:hypothetical protein